MKIFNDAKADRGDLAIEKVIAKQIANGVRSGVIEDNDKNGDGSVYFWALEVNTKI